MTFSNSDITDYISNSDPVKELYRLAMDNGFWPDFPDYKIEKLGRYMDAAKIENIKSIDSLISENFPILEKFIVEVFSHRKNGWHWRLNSVFLCELVLILEYPDIFHRDYLIENEWDKDIAEIVLKAVNRLSPTIPSRSAKSTAHVKPLT